MLEPKISLTIIIIILILLFICIILLYVFFIKQLNILYEEIDKIKSKTKNYSQNEIDNIKSDLATMKKGCDNQKNKYSPGIMSYVPYERYPVPESLVETKNQIPQPVYHNPEYVKYYFSTPNDNGSFLDRNKTTEFEQFSKFFLFKIDNKSPNIAYVTIVDDSETQKHILKNYKEFLDAVCNYSIPFFQSATKIITLKPGKAYLEGERWVIKESDKLYVSFQ